ncbi:MAG TPA: helix-turn-helix domain-containing protein [Propionicimonas sp.]|nr:helix-turn-helix domain-containing protein [Propionicimonas sp.]HRA07420.1 helix-turn-helix domain-containing protein [Propionicimonas sp.]
MNADLEAAGWPSAESRVALSKQLLAASGELTTAALARIAAEHPWFAELDAENRSWINLVARSGIDGFLEWFAAGGAHTSPETVFDAAPRALTRRITLNQTVDLVRTTIDTVEHRISQLPEADQGVLRIGILRYSREVAFAAAKVYARAAESRGAWDARLEAMVVDAVLRGDADESVVSRASTLGWASPAGIAVVIGTVPDDPGAAVQSIREAAARDSLDLLAAPQGDRLVLVIGGQLESTGQLVQLVGGFADQFGSGQIVVGPIVADLVEAARSARAALSGMRAAKAWPGAPRPVASEDLLPERALAGDGHARRTLASELYQPLVATGAELVETLSAFFDASGSIEATARALYVHANTVRYRLRRVQEVTGYSPHDARDAYALRLALTLGRLLD